MAQVTVFSEVLALLENSYRGRLRFEIQVETPQTVLGADGRLPLPEMIRAGGGRVSGLHFGTYDYTASLGILGPYQDLRHPVADFAKELMMLAAAETGVRVSDGSDNKVPVGEPATVAAALARHADGVLRALWAGIYQGWDLHPAQLPTRFAATFAFYRTGSPMPPTGSSATTGRRDRWCARRAGDRLRAGPTSGLGPGLRCRRGGEADGRRRHRPAGRRPLPGARRPAARPGEGHAVKIRDVMSSPAITVTMDSDIVDAATILVGAGFTALPVVDDDGALVGILTEADLLRNRIAPEPRGELRPPTHHRNRATPVMSVMTTPVESLTPGADAADAVRIMLDERIRCLPVVDGTGVVGVVTRRDLLRASIRPETSPRLAGGRPKVLVGRDLRPQRRRVGRPTVGDEVGALRRHADRPEVP